MHDEMLMEESDVINHIFDIYFICDLYECVILCGCVWWIPRMEMDFKG